MTVLIVPTPLAICEHRYAAKHKRGLTIMEAIGLKLKFPVLRPFGGFEGLSRSDERKSLNTVVRTGTPDEVRDVLERRRSALSKIVRARTYSVALATLCLSSNCCMMKDYGIKLKVVLLGPLLYGSTLIGRLGGNVIAGTAKISPADKALVNFAMTKYY